MKSLLSAIPKISYVLFAAFFVTMALRSQDETTIALVLSSILMFALCWANAIHLLGAKAALKFVLIALTLGWFAEHMGASRGWFFGSYDYTDVLGWKLGDVPMVIPLMWFALCYIGYLMSNLIVWQDPLGPAKKSAKSLGITAGMSFLAATIVTAYDLGADPYMVFHLHAWIMTIKNGWWFGETLQGFFGWIFVAFTIIFCFQLSIRQQNLKPGAGFVKSHILLPVSIYAFSMAFQMYVSTPFELRTIAAFAMGIPLLCMMAGWYRWKPLGVKNTNQNALSRTISTARLAQMQYIADPLADQTIATIIGPWKSSTDVADQVEHGDKIAQINLQFKDWTTNQSLVNWQSDDSSIPAEISLPLQSYLASGQILPEWVDEKKIARAETLFMDYGALSCTLLFCSSLPECYVIPDLSAVLHASGQLEQRTEYRIRSTAAMIFPVMLRGGLCQPDGSGVAQILKVRLIHATIRNLILRGSPEEAMRLLGDQLHLKGAAVISPLVAQNPKDMHQVLFAHGWKIGEDGLPCNQEELAYTLLTFSYIFLRSMRTLGLGLSQADEEAYLHIWNVVGHILGLRRELMGDSMDKAQALFAQMQKRGRANSYAPDPRPAMGAALMNTMENVIPFRLLKPFPVLLTRHLCGATNADEIGVADRVSGVSRLIFAAFMLVTRIIDGTVRLILPEFSLTRLITRILGYHFMTQLLMDQTRPLNLPDHLLKQTSDTISTWSDDAKAPKWVNSIEKKFTTIGKWNTPTAN